MKEIPKKNGMQDEPAEVNKEGEDGDAYDCVLSKSAVCKGGRVINTPLALPYGATMWSYHVAKYMTWSYGGSYGAVYGGSYTLAASVGWVPPDLRSAEGVEVLHTSAPLSTILERGGDFNVYGIQ